LSTKIQSNRESVNADEVPKLGQVGRNFDTMGGRYSYFGGRILRGGSFLNAGIIDKRKSTSQEERH